MVATSGSNFINVYSLFESFKKYIFAVSKKLRTKIRNLIKMGVSRNLAWKTGNRRKGYWHITHTVATNMAMTKERLTNSGFYDLATAYQAVYVNY